MAQNFQESYSLGSLMLKMGVDTAPVMSSLNRLEGNVHNFLQRFASAPTRYLEQQLDKLPDYFRSLKWKTGPSFDQEIDRVKREFREAEFERDQRLLSEDNRDRRPPAPEEDDEGRVSFPRVPSPEVANPVGDGPASPEQIRAALERAQRAREQAERQNLERAREIPQGRDDNIFSDQYSQEEQARKEEEERKSRSERQEDILEAEQKAMADKFKAMEQLLADVSTERSIISRSTGAQLGDTEPKPLQIEDVAPLTVEEIPPIQTEEIKVDIPQQRSDKPVVETKQPSKISAEEQEDIDYFKETLEETYKEKGDTQDTLNTLGNMLKMVQRDKSMSEQGKEILSKDIQDLAKSIKRNIRTQETENRERILAEEQAKDQEVKDFYNKFKPVTYEDDEKLAYKKPESKFEIEASDKALQKEYTRPYQLAPELSLEGRAFKEGERLEQIGTTATKQKVFKVDLSDIDEPWAREIEQVRSEGIPQRIEGAGIVGYGDLLETLLSKAPLSERAVALSEVALGEKPDREILNREKLGVQRLKQEQEAIEEAKKPAKPASDDVDIRETMGFSTREGKLVELTTQQIAKYIGQPADANVLGLIESFQEFQGMEGMSPEDLLDRREVAMAKRFIKKINEGIAGEDRAVETSRPSKKVEVKFGEAEELILPESEKRAKKEESILDVSSLKNLENLGRGDFGGMSMGLIPNLEQITLGVLAFKDRIIEAGSAVTNFTRDMSDTNPIMRALRNKVLDTSRLQDLAETKQRVESVIEAKDSGAITDTQAEELLNKVTGRLQDRTGITEEERERLKDTDYIQGKIEEEKAFPKYIQDPVGRNIFQRVAQGFINVEEERINKIKSDPVYSELSSRQEKLSTSLGDLTETITEKEANLSGLERRKATVGRKLEDPTLTEKARVKYEAEDQRLDLKIGQEKTDLIDLRDRASESAKELSEVNRKLQPFNAKIGEASKRAGDMGERMEKMSTSNIVSGIMGGIGKAFAGIGKLLANVFSEALQLVVQGHLQAVKTLYGGLASNVVEGLMLYGSEERSIMKANAVFSAPLAVAKEKDLTPLMGDDSAEGKRRLREAQEIKRQAEEQYKEVEKLSKKAEEEIVKFASLTARTRSQVAEVYLELSRSGLSQQEIVSSGLGNVINLAEASGTQDLSTITYLVTSLRKVFNDTNIEDISKGILALSQTSLAQIQRYRFAFQDAAPVAAQKGINFNKDFIPAMSILFDQMSPEVAGTAFKNVISSVFKPTSENMGLVSLFSEELKKLPGTEGRGLYEGLTTEGEFLNTLDRLYDAADRIITNGKFFGEEYGLDSKLIPRIDEYNDMTDANKRNIQEVIVGRLFGGNETSILGLRALTAFSEEQRKAKQEKIAAFSGFIPTESGQKTIQSILTEIQYKGVLGAIEQVSSSLENVKAGLGKTLAPGAAVGINFVKEFFNSLTAEMGFFTGDLEQISNTLALVFNPESETFRSLRKGVQNFLSTGLGRFEKWIDKFLSTIADPDSVDGFFILVEDMITRTIVVAQEMVSIFIDMVPILIKILDLLSWGISVLGPFFNEITAITSVLAASAIVASATGAPGLGAATTAIGLGTAGLAMSGKQDTALGATLSGGAMFGGATLAALIAAGVLTGGAATLPLLGSAAIVSAMTAGGAAQGYLDFNERERKGLNNKNLLSENKRLLAGSANLELAEAEEESYAEIRSTYIPKNNMTFDEVNEASYLQKGPKWRQYRSERENLIPLAQKIGDLTSKLGLENLARFAEQIESELEGNEVETNRLADDLFNLREKLYEKLIQQAENDIDNVTFEMKTLFASNFLRGEPGKVEEDPLIKQLIQETDLTSDDFVEKVVQNIPDFGGDLSDKLESIVRDNIDNNTDLQGTSPLFEKFQAYDEGDLDDQVKSLFNTLMSLDLEGPGSQQLVRNMAEATGTSRDSYVQTLKENQARFKDAQIAGDQVTMDEVAFSVAKQIEQAVNRIQAQAISAAGEELFFGESTITARKNPLSTTMTQNADNFKVFAENVAKGTATPNQIKLLEIQAENERGDSRIAAMNLVELLSKKTIEGSRFVTTGEGNEQRNVPIAIIPPETLADLALTLSREEIPLDMEDIIPVIVEASDKIVAGINDFTKFIVDPTKSEGEKINFLLDEAQKTFAKDDVAFQEYLKKLGVDEKELYQDVNTIPEAIRLFRESKVVGEGATAVDLMSTGEVMKKVLRERRNELTSEAREMQIKTDGFRTPEGQEFFKNYKEEFQDFISINEALSAAMGVTAVNTEKLTEITTGHIEVRRRELELMRKQTALLVKSLSLQEEINNVTRQTLVARAAIDGSPSEALSKAITFESQIEKERNQAFAARMEYRAAAYERESVDEPDKKPKITLKDREALNPYKDAIEDLQDNILPSLIDEKEAKKIELITQQAINHLQKTFTQIPKLIQQNFSGASGFFGGAFNQIGSFIDKFQTSFNKVFENLATVDYLSKFEGRDTSEFKNFLVNNIGQIFKDGIQNILNTLKVQVNEFIDSVKAPIKAIAGEIKALLPYQVRNIDREIRDIESQEAKFLRGNEKQQAESEVSVRNLEFGKNLSELESQFILPFSNNELKTQIMGSAFYKDFQSAQLSLENFRLDALKAQEKTYTELIDQKISATIVNFANELTESLVGLLSKFRTSGEKISDQLESDKMTLDEVRKEFGQLQSLGVQGRLTDRGNQLLSALTEVIKGAGDFEGIEDKITQRAIVDFNLEEFNKEAKRMEKVASLLNKVNENNIKYIKNQSDSLVAQRYTAEMRLRTEELIFEKTKERIETENRLRLQRGTPEDLQQVRLNELELRINEEGLESTREDVRDLNDEFGTFFEEMGDTMTGVITNFFDAVIEGKDDVMESFRDVPKLLQKIFARRLIANFIEPLFKPWGERDSQPVDTTADYSPKPLPASDPLIEVRKLVREISEEINRETTERVNKFDTTMSEFRTQMEGVISSLENSLSNLSIDVTKIIESYNKLAEDLSNLIDMDELGNIDENVESIRETLDDLTEIIKTEFEGFGEKLKSGEIVVSLAEGSLNLSGIEGSENLLDTIYSNLGIDPNKTQEPAKPAPPFEGYIPREERKPGIHYGTTPSGARNLEELALGVEYERKLDEGENYKPPLNRIGSNFNTAMEDNFGGKPPLNAPENRLKLIPNTQGIPLWDEEAKQKSERLNGLEIPDKPRFIIPEGINIHTPEGRKKASELRVAHDVAYAKLFKDYNEYNTKVRQGESPPIPPTPSAYFAPGTTDLKPSTSRTQTPKPPQITNVPPKSEPPSYPQTNVVEPSEENIPYIDAPPAWDGDLGSNKQRGSTSNIPKPGALPPPTPLTSSGKTLPQPPAPQVVNQQQAKSPLTSELPSPPSLPSESKSVEEEKIGTPLIRFSPGDHPSTRYLHIGDKTIPNVSSGFEILSKIVFIPKVETSDVLTSRLLTKEEFNQMVRKEMTILEERQQSGRQIEIDDKQSSTGERYPWSNGNEVAALGYGIPPIPNAVNPLIPEGQIAPNLLTLNKGGLVNTVLTPQEIVVPRNQAQQIGYGTLEFINNLDKGNLFKGGGVVPGGTSKYGDTVPANLNQGDYVLNPRAIDVLTNRKNTGGQVNQVIGLAQKFFSGADWSRFEGKGSELLGVTGLGSATGGAMTLASQIYGIVQGSKQEAPPDREFLAQEEIDRTIAFTKVREKEKLRFSYLEDDDGNKTWLQTRFSGGIIKALQTGGTYGFTYNTGTSSTGAGGGSADGAYDFPSVDILRQQQEKIAKDKEKIALTAKQETPWYQQILPYAGMLATAFLAGGGKDDDDDFDPEDSRIKTYTPFGNDPVKVQRKTAAGVSDYMEKLAVKYGYLDKGSVDKWDKEQKKLKGRNKGGVINDVLNLGIKEPQTFLDNLERGSIFTGSGKLEGWGKSNQGDIVPAILNDGDYVINADAVTMLEKGFPSTYKSLVEANPLKMSESILDEFLSLETKNTGGLIISPVDRDKTLRQRGSLETIGEKVIVRNRGGKIPSLGKEGRLDDISNELLIRNFGGKVHPNNLPVNGLKIHGAGNLGFRQSPTLRFPGRLDDLANEAMTRNKGGLINSQNLNKTEFSQEPLLFTANAKKYRRFYKGGIVNSPVRDIIDLNKVSNLSSSHRFNYINKGINLEKYSRSDRINRIFNEPPQVLELGGKVKSLLNNRQDTQQTMAKNMFSQVLNKNTAFQRNDSKKLIDRTVDLANHTERHNTKKIFDNIARKKSGYGYFFDENYEFMTGLKDKLYEHKNEPDYDLIKKYDVYNEPIPKEKLDVSDKYGIFGTDSLLGKLGDKPDGYDYLFDSDYKFMENLNSAFDLAQQDNTPELGFTPPSSDFQIDQLPSTDTNNIGGEGLMVTDVMEDIKSPAEQLSQGLNDTSDSIKVDYNVTKINNIEYVSRSEFESGLMSAAHAGAGIVQNKLKFNPAYRSNLGL